MFRAPFVTKGSNWTGTVSAEFTTKQKNKSDEELAGSGSGNNTNVESFFTLSEEHRLQKKSVEEKDLKVALNNLKENRGRTTRDALIKRGSKIVLRRKT